MGDQTLPMDNTRLAALSAEARLRAVSRLRATGLRPTRQRVALAALLLGDGLDRHVSAEILHDAARHEGAQVSLATVYNTLRVFCAAGLLKETSVDGHRSYFDTRLDDHPHFYWEDEGRLTDAPMDELRIEQLPQPPEGMEIAKVDVVVRLRRR